MALDINSIIVESLLRGVNNQTFTDFTSTEGASSITRGAGSHTEGDSTQTGNFLGWFSNPVASPTSGVIVISGSYGSVKTIIDNSNATHVLVNSSPGSPGVQVVAYEIASVTNVGSPASASINLVDNTVNFGSQVVVGLSNTPSPSGADQYVYGGNYSHAEGYLSQTVGDWSHAEGRQTIAIGENSHVEGIESIAIGDYSHASGIGTLATKLGQTALGQYNKANNKTDLFVIGNGTNTSSRSDIFSVSTSSVIISGSLNISGSITGSLFGTASWAESATSASYIPNLVTGNVGEILLSNGDNTITSTPDFTFDNSYQSLTINRNDDYNSNSYSTPFTNYEFGHANNAFTINNNYTYARNYYFVYQTLEGTTAQISRLTVKSGTNLLMYGLKCDYCLTIADPNASPVEITGTRTGVFTCAWDSDGSTTQLVDSIKAIGDATMGELVNVTFTLSWAGDDIIVYIDTTGVLPSSQIGFMGYFTLFTS